MNKQPLVSVIMGIYNCADTLAESLDSCVGIYGLYEKKKFGSNMFCKKVLEENVF